jgi:hypothetical protein
LSITTAAKLKSSCSGSTGYEYEPFRCAARDFLSRRQHMRSIADSSPAVASIRLGAKHMTESLAETRTPCRGGVPPFPRNKALRFQAQAPD